MRVWTLVSLLLAVTACSSTQRATVGASIGSVGLAFVGGALESMMWGDCVRRGPRNDCVEYSQPLSPKVGLPVAVGSLGVALLGGVLIVTSIKPEPPQASLPTLAHPARLVGAAMLDETEAVGMAIARLVVVGIDGRDSPSQLIGIDGTQSELFVEFPHAELRELRVHTASDDAWVTLFGCYDHYDGEWRLTSLSTVPWCVP